METTIETVLRNRRSLEQALNDLRTKQLQQPNTSLERMIAQLEAEIAARAIGRSTRPATVRRGDLDLAA
jgi:hypothetical protein